MLAQRDRRRWLVGFRKPKALRASSLISRLTPSLAALAPYRAEDLVGTLHDGEMVDDQRRVG
jgi:hypothetical protein